MSIPIMITIVLTISGLFHIASADCMCVAAGDPHYVMCDGKTRYDWQGTGLFQMFKTDTVEVQCLNRPVGPVSMIDYCRIKVTSGDCDLVIQTPSESSHLSIINGKNYTNPTDAYIDPMLNTNVLSAKGNLLDIKIKQGDEVIKIKAGPATFTVTTSNVNNCTGMCGTCSGKQTKPKDIRSYAETFAKVAPISGGTSCIAANKTTSPTTSPNKTTSPTSAPTETPPPTTVIQARIVDWVVLILYLGNDDSVASRTQVHGAK
uniref:VWFD domain-containing protein n=1 Tax=Spongospora subterranea TaxID=70186 RepID=A0A0H5QRR4_9EUKA|eukprot:CRZ04302.1 hypothetical protein [Spongospora subterranea]